MTFGRSEECVRLLLQVKPCLYVSIYLKSIFVLFSSSLQAGCNASAVDKHGKSALHLAAIRGVRDDSIAADFPQYFPTNAAGLSCREDARRKRM